ncbi:TolC family outer membrane protein [Tianweitania populi]|uniref:Transporter n=1 Tax=Tianweitania populi TaxID=1607949 RepID=A0A8J3DUD0_9HYPH|nr:TolC family outer membrane protein [Tianweitania populi]GHD07977.1 transporter [Tianweitania populi]
MSIFSKSLFAALLSTSVAFSSAAFSESLTGALAKAYEFNSQLNSARAGVRVTDEGVAIAKSGYRPVVAGFSNYSLARQSGFRLQTGGFGVSVSQTLFDGFQTRNNVRAAESQVFAQREALRNSEMNILQNAVTAYMDVIRDRRVAALLQQNLAFLEEQVRAANSRFEVGEGTRTDVAQADATRASAVAQLAAARAQALSSAATYRQVIGSEPDGLTAAAPITKLLPSTLDRGISTALLVHPAIKSNLHVVDATEFTVKAAEGALLPQLSAEGTVQRSYRDSSPSTTQDGETDAASVGLQLNIPIYNGGRTSATVRRNKEQVGQARIDVDVSRDQVRQAVTAAWTQYIAAQQSIAANRELVSAAQLALSGVQEELNVGQRTTLDVLDQQADVITAQVNLANSERDAVVASYAILSATGQLFADKLGLKVAAHDPKEHYNAVKDKWFGLRTPDGR